MRSWAPRALLVGPTILVLSVAVLCIVGAHASGLGSDPAWAFDCDDTTCEDLWIGPRTHDRLVAAGCCLAILAGWAVTGLGLSSSSAPPSEHPAPWASVVPPPPWLVLLAAPTCAAALGAFLTAGSLPWGLAGAAAPMLVAGVCAWLGLRSRGCPSRAAWYVAAGEVLLSILVTATVTALAFELLSVAAIPAGTVAGGVGACLAHVLVGRRWRRQASRRSGPQPGHRSGPQPGQGQEPGPGPGRGTHAVVVDALCMLALLSLAAWAAWPVPAAPADAWQTQGSAQDSAQDQVPAPSPSATATPPTPSPSSLGPDAQPIAGSLEAHGLADCAAGDLEVVITGWSAAMGDTAAAIEVTNTGSRPCALRGRPHVSLHQDGEDLELTVDTLPASRGIDEGKTQEDIGMSPGARAQATLFWKGYGRAADTSTPQQAEITIGDSGPVPAEFLSGVGGHGTAAPFDLVHGAHIEVSGWSPGP